jgi:hypothetical protein
MPGPCSVAIQAAGQQEGACNEARQQKTEEATGMAALLRLLWVRV